MQRATPGTEDRPHPKLFFASKGQAPFWSMAAQLKAAKYPSCVNLLLAVAADKCGCKPSNWSSERAKAFALGALGASQQVDG